MWHQNHDSHRKLVVKLRCWPSRFATGSDCFCKWMPKIILQSRMWPEKLLFWATDSHQFPACYTKILIRIEVRWSNSTQRAAVHTHPAEFQTQRAAFHTQRAAFTHNGRPSTHDRTSKELPCTRASKYHLHSICYGWRVGIVYTHPHDDRPRGRHSDLTLNYCYSLT